MALHPQRTAHPGAQSLVVLARRESALRVMSPRRAAVLGLRVKPSFQCRPSKTEPNPRESTVAHGRRHGARAREPLEENSREEKPERYGGRYPLGVWVALIALYLVWGSTYLAIRIAIETLPPFFMAAVRMVLAGGLLYALARLRGAAAPTKVHWRHAFVIGAFLLLGGNGLVVWAAQSLPTGLLSLLVGATPLAMVLVGWVGNAEARPRPQTLGGLALGMAGLVWLLMPGHLSQDHPLDLVSAAAALAATFSWAVGSHYARRAELPRSQILTIAMEMLSGGILLAVAAVAAGEFGKIHLERISIASALALLYLVIFGSLVGFSAYIYLLERTKPALATSYAFVNPLVAVFLGWLVRNEPIGVHVIGGGVLILAAVILITVDRERAAQLAPESEIELT